MTVIGKKYINAFKYAPPVIEVNFLMAVYPSGQTNLSSWKCSESLTIFPARSFHMPLSRMVVSKTHQ